LTINSTNGPKLCITARN